MGHRTRRHVTPGVLEEAGAERVGEHLATGPDLVESIISWPNAGCYGPDHLGGVGSLVVAAAREARIVMWRAVFVGSVPIWLGLVLCGCGADAVETASGLTSAPPSPVQPATPAEPAEVEPEIPPISVEPVAADPAPDVTEPTTNPAIAAYRAALSAFNRRELEDYFGAFEDPVACFHGRSDVPVATVRAARADQAIRNFDAAPGGLAVWMLYATTLSVSPAEVVFVDVGIDGGCSVGASGTHEKIVVMRRTESGEWRIHAETSTRSTACLSTETRAALRTAEVRAVSDECTSRHESCVARCGRRCAGEGADSSGCTACWEECPCELGACTNNRSARRTLCLCVNDYEEPE